MNGKEIFRQCVKRLGRTDGHILFTHITGKTAAQMLLKPDFEMQVCLEPFFERYAAGEPIQYIVGETAFMGLPFCVSPAVLIPRQDTETLVEFAVSALKDKPNARGLDLCTGSGCIAVSMAVHAKANMLGVDISGEALAVAEKNAKRNGVAVSFLQADAKTFVSEEAMDFVLSNPPYIESAVVEALDIRVKDYEPRLALDGGADGLCFYQSIAENSYKSLKKGGFLAVEIGYNQGEAVQKIMRRVFDNGTVLKDLCGNDRVVYAYK